MRIKLYRGKYYVVRVEKGRTRRIALRTEDREVAARRFEDFKRDFRPERHTVGEIMDAYIDDRSQRVVRIDRIKDAWKALKPHFGHLRPDQIDRDSCRRYAEARRQVRFRNRKTTVQDGTIIKELTVLRAGLRWQDKNTPAVFEMPPSPQPRERHLSREEYGSLLKAAKRTPHLYLFITVALATAGRSEAILELTWDRVDFQKGEIDLRKGTGTRKGRAVVPMTPSVKTLLHDAKRAALTPYVIEYAEGPVHSVKKAFSRAALEAGLNDVTPHVIRHSAAVWMAEAGAPMGEIAAYLGHSDDRITQRVYARFSPMHLRRAAAALDFPVDSSPWSNRSKQG